MKNALACPLSRDQSLVSKFNGVKVLFALTFVIIERALSSSALFEYG